ncbi:MAG: DUF6992 family protein [Janthinobacterium lividum]
MYTWSSLFLTVPAAAAPVASWLAAYQGREQLLGRGLAVLGTWALLNLIASGYLLPRTDPRHWLHHFHLMNCGWAFVNAIIATAGILRTHPGHPPAGFTPTGALGEQAFLVKVFFGNALLDAGYLLVGLWLLRRAAASTTRRPERLLGYGRSVQLQGAFLLLFDVVMGFLVK